MSPKDSAALLGGIILILALVGGFVSIAIGTSL